MTKLNYIAWYQSITLTIIFMITIMLFAYGLLTDLSLPYVILIGFICGITGALIIKLLYERLLLERY